MLKLISKLLSQDKRRYSDLKQAGFWLRLDRIEREAKKLCERKREC